MADHDSTTNRPTTIDDLLEEWRIHGGWNPTKAEMQRLVDEIERLATKLAGHDEGLDRWCNYQDRLVETLDRLGLRQQVLAELERDGWKNPPECAHKAEIERLQTEVDGLADLLGDY